MIEAWIVLPALGLAYLVCANEGWIRRVLHLGLTAVVTGLVSLSWMTVVSLVPSGSRPYVDGSQNDSLFHQVFVYNGLGRVDQLSPNQQLAQSVGVRIPLPPPASWDRLLMGHFGRDIGWLIPAACILAVVGLLATWRNRDDPSRPARAAFILWGTWLATFSVTFSTTSSINPYYLAALAPPLAGLLGAGGALLWSRRDDLWARICALVVAATVAYQVWLLPVGGTGQPGWLAPVVVVVGSVVVVMLAAMLVMAGFGHRVNRIASLAVVSALVVVSLIPAVASVSVAASGLGPFDTPFQRHVVTRATRAFFDVIEPAAADLPGLERVRGGAPFLMATQTSPVAAPFIYVSGQEVLPIGGYTGTIPEPTLPALKAMVHAGDFHVIVQSPKTTDPRLVWIAKHCQPAPQPRGQKTVHLAIYYCLRSASIPARPGS
jgi:4-amino-4-deoxy-L-arabinose transferase-like glycosyltransferase